MIDTSVAGELIAIAAEAVAALSAETRVAAAIAGIDWPAPTAVIAVGKAALAMARGAQSVAAARGLVVAPDGAPGAAGLPWPVLRASHPVPDARSEAAGRAALALAASLPADGRLLALISGGASALAAVPASGVTLAAKVARTAAVAASGATIAELNAVRSALSAIKGGRLAAACPAPVWTLVASDVVGDDVAVVGSGPTILPHTARVASLMEALAEADAEAPMEARRGDRVLRVAGVADLAAAALTAAAARGLVGRLWTAALAGDVAAVAVRAVAELDAGPGLVIAAGEPTLALPARPGQGGRARHLALVLARAIAGRRELTCLVAGSDGVDGTGPAAGAVVDGGSWARLAAAGVDGDRALAGFDSGRALAAIGADIVTGPTGVNHADLLLLHRAC